MKTLIIPFLLTCLAFGQNTPKFPTATAGLQDLGFATDAPNRSVLTSGINSSTLTVPVASGAAFRPYNILTFADSGEQVMICSISLNTLTACARGFAGTTPASHGNGIGVLGNVTAWHHNQLAAEIKALEEGLGANLANVVQTGGSYTDPSWLTLTKGKVGLSAVENTALSTWAGSANITAIGTLASGTVPWSLLSNVPSSFTPSLHASAHGSGQADPITIAQSQVTSLVSDLGAKAPIDNPRFTGNVGIGGSFTPTRLLHIQSASTGSSPGITIESIDTGGKAYSILSTATGSVAGVGKFAIFEAGNARLIIDANGNVGIGGTTDPKSKLHVTGLPAYASNALAISGGLTAGAIYHDGSGNLKVVY